MVTKKLPFVWRNTGSVASDTTKKKLAALASEFMLVEEIDGFLRYERHHTPTEPSSVLIILPGGSFYKNKETYRSDIKWMWKVLAQDYGRVNIGHNGLLFLLVTDEVLYYSPGKDVTIGSFGDTELLWGWIKYVTSKSWYKQKQGQLRKIFKLDPDVPAMLKRVSELLILGDL